MDFEMFWAVWPDRKNRASAAKAFIKLKPDEREKAINRAGEWCREWRKENPQASHIHASTYLNQKRFLDMDEKRQSVKVDEIGVMEMQAAWIRDGKDFLCRNLSPTRVAQIVQAGLVSREQAGRFL